MKLQLALVTSVLIVSTAALGIPWTVSKTAMSRFSAGIDYSNMGWREIFVSGGKLILSQEKTAIHDFNNDRSLGILNNPTLTIDSGELIVQGSPYAGNPLSTIRIRDLKAGSLIVETPAEGLAIAIARSPHALSFFAEDSKGDFHFWKSDIDMKLRTIKPVKHFALPAHSQFLVTRAGDILTPSTLHRLTTEGADVAFTNKLDSSYFSNKRTSPYQGDDYIAFLGLLPFARGDFNTKVWTETILKDQNGNNPKNYSWGVNWMSSTNVFAEEAVEYVALSLNLKSAKLLTFEPEVILEGILPDDTVVLKNKSTNDVRYVDSTTGSSVTKPSSFDIGSVSENEAATCTDNSVVRLAHYDDKKIDVYFVKSSPLADMRTETCVNSGAISWAVDLLEHVH